MKKIAAFSVLIVLALLVLGCPLPQSSLTGELVLSFTPATAKGAKNLLPLVDMNIATYDVSGSGPNSATFSQQNVTTTLTVTALVQGAWTITVNGKNSAGTVIGTGTASVTIVGGQTATATVTVAPLTGNGDLSLTVSWASGMITTPSVTGTLTPVGGSGSNIAFTLAGDSLSASYDSGSTLSAGYYTLSLIVEDATTSVWGGTEAVRIVAGNTTTGTFTLNATDISNFSGNVNITITPAMNSPIQITLTGQKSLLPVGSTMTVVATPSTSVDSYQWFLNGVPINGQTSSSFSAGSGLSVGNYRLDVQAQEGNILGSISSKFSVVPLWTSFGTFGSGTGNLSSPMSVAFDSAGRIYIGDAGNQRIVRMDDMNGTNWVSYGIHGSGAGNFASSVGIAVAPDGRIYIADNSNSRIIRIDDMSGKNWTTYGTAGSGVGNFNGITYMAFDSTGRLYLTDTYNSRIVRIDDMSGTHWTAYGTFGSSAGNFNSPSGIAVDSSGNIYVGDTQNYRIVRISDMSGSGWTTYGTQGSGSGSFLVTMGIVIGADGKIYFVDQQNYRVVRINNFTGAGWTTYGTQGTGTGNFANPNGLGIDASGMIYVTDTNWSGLNRIVRFAPSLFQ